MTRDELLTKLAMENTYDSWQEFKRDTCTYQGYTFTLAEFAARRAELISEPDDADAPEGMYWRCQKPNGQWLWFDKRPCQIETVGGWFGNKSQKSNLGKIPAGHDWRQTLREVNQEHAQPRTTFEVTPEEEEAFKALEASAGKDWRGPEDGLPPVGAVCEYLFSKNNEWRKGHCVAHFQEQAVIVDAVDSGAECCIEQRLRPIRTDRERWIEAVDSLVEEKAGTLYSRAHPKDVAQFIYDAMQSGKLPKPEDV